MQRGAGGRSGLSSTDNFFEERSDQSEVKSRIVSKFFASWSSVIVSTAKRSGRVPKLAYIDLFAGPGVYEDGTKSTPLLVMERAIASPDLANGLSAIFNDADPDHADCLRQAIEGLAGYSRLRHKPMFMCGAVGSQAEQAFAQARMVPTLSFLDPFGYKGLTSTLLAALTKDWGSDCIFFFNYRRVNSAINYEGFRPHIDALFGAERAALMRMAVCDMRPHERIDYVLSMLKEALGDKGLKFTLPFVFWNENGTRPTHALIYAAKSPKGHTIMKHIMAAESTWDVNGMPSYSHSPADAKRAPTLLLDDPIAGLANDLFVQYEGSQLTVGDLISREEPGSRFLDRNFREAILTLELDSRVTAVPRAADRPRRHGRPTCGPSVKLSFRERDAA